MHDTTQVCTNFALNVIINNYKVCAKSTLQNYQYSIRKIIVFDLMYCLSKWRYCFNISEHKSLRKPVTLSNCVTLTTHHESGPSSLSQRWNIWSSRCHTAPIIQFTLYLAYIWPLSTLLVKLDGGHAHNFDSDVGKSRPIWPTAWIHQLSYQSHDPLPSKSYVKP